MPQVTKKAKLWPMKRQFGQDVNLEVCVYFWPWTCFCTVCSRAQMSRPQTKLPRKMMLSKLTSGGDDVRSFIASSCSFFTSISSDSAAGLAQLDSQCAHLAMTWWSFVHVDSSLHVCINAHADLSLHSYMYMCIHVGLRVCIQLMPSNCSTPFVRLTLIYTVLFSRTTTTVAGYRVVAGQLFSDV